MFKFSSTHIISSNKDFYCNEAGIDKGMETSPLGASFVVGKNFKFFEKAVEEVRKATPTEAQTETIKFTMPDLTDKVSARLNLYLRSVDNADPLYANDWIYKGKPFAIEFKGAADAEKAAQNLVDNANKWINFIFGSKVLEITNEGAEVTIAVTEDTNLRFFKVEVQELGPADGDADVSYLDYVFNTVKGWSANADLKESYDDVLEVEYTQEGKSGFGTYDYLVKNLRLPTNANMHWLSINNVAGELPAPGASYVQYIVKQCTERPEVQGISVVGQYNKSVTYHILWVLNNDELVKAVEDGFAAIGVTEFASVEPKEEESTDDTTGEETVQP